MADLVVVLNTVMARAKEHQRKEDMKKRMREAVDLEEVKSRLETFELQKFQSSLAVLAAKANMSIEWVGEDYSGGWHGNVLIRELDENGLDIAVRPIIDIAKDVLVGLEPNTNIIYMRVHTKEVPTGEHDQMLYYYCSKDSLNDDDQLSMSATLTNPGLIEPSAPPELDSTTPTKVESEYNGEKEDDAYKSKRLRLV